MIRTGLVWHEMMYMSKVQDYGTNFCIFTKHNILIETNDEMFDSTAQICETFCAGYSFVDENIFFNRCLCRKLYSYLLLWRLGYTAIVGRWQLTSLLMHLYSSITIMELWHRSSSYVVVKLFNGLYCQSVAFSCPGHRLPGHWLVLLLTTTASQPKNHGSK